MTRRHAAHEQRTKQGNMATCKTSCKLCTILNDLTTAEGSHSKRIRLRACRQCRSHHHRRLHRRLTSHVVCCCLVCVIIRVWCVMMTAAITRIILKNNQRQKTTSIHTFGFNRVEVFIRKKWASKFRPSQRARWGGQTSEARAQGPRATCRNTSGMAPSLTSLIHLAKV